VAVSVTAALGFVAAGCHAGIKHRRHDMAMVATADLKPVTAVAVFTQNKFAAPPVILDRARLAESGGKTRVVFIYREIFAVITAGKGRPIVVLQSLLQAVSNNKSRHSAKLLGF